MFPDKMTASCPEFDSLARAALSSRTAPQLLVKQGEAVASRVSSATAMKSFLIFFYLRRFEINLCRQHAGQY